MKRLLVLLLLLAASTPAFAQYSVQALGVAITNLTSGTSTITSGSDKSVCIDDGGAINCALATILFNKVSKEFTLMRGIQLGDDSANAGYIQIGDGSFSVDAIGLIGSQYHVYIEDSAANSKVDLRAQGNGVDGGSIILKNQDSNTGIIQLSADPTVTSFYLNDPTGASGINMLASESVRQISMFAPDGSAAFYVDAVNSQMALGTFGLPTSLPGSILLADGVDGEPGIADKVAISGTGWMQIKPVASPPFLCTGAEGSFYNDTSHALCWCDGTTWTKVSGAGTCS